MGFMGLESRLFQSEDHFAADRPSSTSLSLGRLEPGTDEKHQLPLIPMALLCATRTGEGKKDSGATFTPSHLAVHIDTPITHLSSNLGHCGGCSAQDRGIIL